MYAEAVGHAWQVSGLLKTNLTVDALPRRLRISYDAPSAMMEFVPEDKAQAPLDYYYSYENHPESDSDIEKSAKAWHAAVVASFPRTIAAWDSELARVRGLPLDEDVKTCWFRL